MARIPCPLFFNDTHDFTRGAAGDEGITRKGKADSEPIPGRRSVYSVELLLFFSPLSLSLLFSHFISPFFFLFLSSSLLYFLPFSSFHLPCVPFLFLFILFSFFSFIRLFFIVQTSLLLDVYWVQRHFLLSCFSFYLPYTFSFKLELFSFI